MTDDNATPEGMQAVNCQLCGYTLGWQEAADPVDWSVWCHSRCPERQARAFDLTRDQIEELTVDIQESILASFPDLVGDIRGRNLRTRITAEYVLERFIQQGWKVSETDVPLHGNVYGRVLPVAQQKASACVDCGHPHWDTIRKLFVRCGMCLCENVGSNNIPLGLS